MKAKKLNGNTVLLIITIVLFFVMYAVGCVSILFFKHFLKHSECNSRLSCSS